MVLVMYVLWLVIAQLHSAVLLSVLVLDPDASMNLAIPHAWCCYQGKLHHMHNAKMLSKCLPVTPMK